MYSARWVKRTVVVVGDGKVHWRRWMGAPVILLSVLLLL